ncbi:MAG: hypothetical protein LIO90_00905 [Bacteroidales bacterium]|nr:hypothetical protein [Bacteroidales bacterium]
MKDQKKLIFLPGGWDLEMQTIVGLLQGRDDCIVASCGRRLEWGATLSAYQQQLKEYADATLYAIYGIELIDDSAQQGFSVPSNYYSINHHDQEAGKPSSLEQVCQLLGVKMDHRLQLIAANDCDYIPGMQRLGATEEEIAEIRLADRAAQGVTPQEEAEAEELCRSIEPHKGVITIKAPSSHFSPITDRLWMREEPKMIYTDEEFCFYGPTDTISNLAALYRARIENNKMYRGRGYLGSGKGNMSPEDQKKIREEIITPFMSRHIFYFPFRCGNVIPEESNGCWVRGGDPQEDLYNEKQYFLEYVQDALYDENVPGSWLRHFEWHQEDPMQYVIMTKKGKEIKLDLNYINLNFYCPIEEKLPKSQDLGVGVGILSLHCSCKDDAMTLADILSFNQLGRRTIKPNAGGYGIAASLEIRGAKGLNTTKEIFQGTEPWKPSQMVVDLIKTLSPDIIIQPIVDDRMFVLCSVGDDALSESLKKDIVNDDWYRLLFVDDPDELTCQNKEMKQRLLKEASYVRWQSYGTIVGVSRYSLVSVTSQWFANSKYHNDMTTLYARMYELCIAQLALLLTFSAELTEISKNKGEYNLKTIERIEHFYRSYIRFENRMAHNKVTQQDQGIELYDLMQRQLAINEQTHLLDEKISETHQFISLKIEGQRSLNGFVLNILAAAFLIPSLAIGIFQILKWDETWEVIITIALLVIIILLLRWLNPETFGLLWRKFKQFFLRKKHE